MASLRQSLTLLSGHVVLVSVFKLQRIARNLLFLASVIHFEVLNLLYGVDSASPTHQFWSETILDVTARVLIFLGFKQGSAIEALLPSEVSAQAEAGSPCNAKKKLFC